MYSRTSRLNGSRKFSDRLRKGRTCESSSTAPPVPLLLLAPPTCSSDAIARDMVLMRSSTVIHEKLCQAAGQQRMNVCPALVVAADANKQHMLMIRNPFTTGLKSKTATMSPKP